MILHLTREELADFPVAAVTLRGKQVQADETVAAARQALVSDAVQVLPVLDGGRYVGAVDRETLADAGSAATSVGPLAGALLPVATAATRTRDALDALDTHGGTRLVVLEDDGQTYLGLVCLRGDRERLCLDSETLGV